MWDYQLIIYILLLTIIVHSQEVLNSTNEQYLIATKDALPIWTNQQLVMCFVSVTIGTILFFITFIVPIMIIIRRARRDKNRFDLRELRRMSDFM